MVQDISAALTSFSCVLNPPVPYLPLFLIGCGPGPLRRKLITYLMYDAEDFSRAKALRTEHQGRHVPRPDGPLGIGGAGTQLDQKGACEGHAIAGYDVVPSGRTMCQITSK